tara:strand:+ start:45 stop:2855 length:2811 start_codon:yes stop_codon:yes gene_type:complete
MTRFLQQDQINVTKVVGMNVTNIFMHTIEDAHEQEGGNQVVSRRDIPVVEFKLDLEFDKQQLLQSRTSHIEVFLNTNIENKALDRFIDVINRQSGDFNSRSEYINYLNNLRNAYDSIDNALEVERYNLFNWEHITSVDPKQYIDISEQNDFAIDAGQETLRLSNTASPLPQITKRFLPKNKLVIKRTPTRLASTPSKTKGIRIRQRRNSGEDIIPKASNMNIVRQSLAKQGVSLSEAFRESKHESILDTIMGNIDTQHPSDNPATPRIQVEEIINQLNEQYSGDDLRDALNNALENERQSLINARDSGYQFFPIPSNKFIVSIRMLISDKDIKDTFQVKCVVCARGRFAPHQILIENVDYDVIKQSRIDLARPSVKARINSGKPQEIALNISVQAGTEGANAPGPGIDWIDAYKIKRKPVQTTNEVHAFVELATIKIDQRAPRNNGIDTITYLDRALPADGKRYEYRVIPVNYFGEEGVRFVDAITPNRPLPIVPGAERNRINQLSRNTTISAIQNRGQKIKITINNINFEATSLEILRRNLSIGKHAYHVIEEVRLNREDTEIMYIDADVKRLYVYEYVVKLKDLRGHSVISQNTAIIDVKPVNSEISYNTIIKNIEYDGNFVKFEMQTTFNKQNLTAKNISRIQRAIAANNLENIYEDILRSELFTENGGIVPMHVVTRWNVSRGQAEGDILAVDGKFNEADINKSGDRQNANDEYKFIVETTIIDINNVIAGLNDPSVLEIIGVQKQNIDGTIRQNNVDDILDKSIAPGGKIVNLPREKPTIQIRNLTIKNDRSERISINWKIQGDVDALNFFHIERQINNLRKESLGTTHINTYFDRLERPDLFGCTLVYYVTAILNDGSMTETVQASIKTPEENADVQLQSNRQSRNAKSRNRAAANAGNENANSGRAGGLRRRSGGSNRRSGGSRRRRPN